MSKHNSLLHKAQVLRMSRSDFDIDKNNTTNIMKIANFHRDIEVIEESMRVERDLATAHAQTVADRLSRLKFCEAKFGARVNPSLTMLNCGIAEGEINLYTHENRKCLTFGPNSKHNSSTDVIHQIVALSMHPIDNVIFFVDISICGVPSCNIKWYSMISDRSWIRVLPCVYPVEMSIREYTDAFSMDNDSFITSLMRRFSSGEAVIRLVEKPYLESETNTAISTMFKLDTLKYADAVCKELDYHRAVIIVADAIREQERILAMTRDYRSLAVTRKEKLKPFIFGPEYSGNEVAFATADHVPEEQDTSPKGICSYCHESLKQITACSKCGCHLCFAHAFQMRNKEGQVQFFCQNCFGA